MALEDVSEAPRGSKHGGLAIAGAVFLFLLLMLPAGNYRRGLTGAGVLDPDSYERLLRVERLIRTGAWYDTSTPWAQALGGSELHWTRPYDVLVATAAMPFRVVYPSRQALVLGGSFVSLLLGSAVVGTLAWTARAFAGSAGVVFIGFAVAAQQALARSFRFTYIDHHALLLLLAAIAWAAVAKSFVRTSRTAGVIAGLAAGIGVWVSVESLLWIATLIVSLALLWICEGDQSFCETLGLMLAVASVTTAGALLIERPPRDWLQVDMDRVSIAHAVLFSTIALAWTAGTRLIVRRASGLARLGICVLLLVGALGLVICLFPSFVGGPMADVSPAARLLLLEGNAEFRPFQLHDRVYRSALCGGAATLVISAAYSMLVLRRSRRDATSRVALLTFIFLLVFVPLFLFQWRWIVTVQLACSVPWMLALRAVLGGRGAPSFARVLLAATLAASPVVLALSTFPRDVLRPAAPTASLQVQKRGASTRGSVAVGDSHARRGRSAQSLSGGECNYRGLGAAIGGATGKRPHEILLLAPFYDGPQIAWQTGMRVVSGPYHRNAVGLTDIVEALSAGDDDATRRIMRLREVDFIVLCRANAASRALAKRNPHGLTARLLKGENAPGWLQQVAIAEGVDRRIGVWRALPEPHL